MSLLVEAFEELPKPRAGDDPDLFRAGFDAALGTFRRAVRERYTEGTLTRILASHLDPAHRHAAAVALGLVGTMTSNAVLAAALRDDDEAVRKAAAESIWEVWFRDDADHARELRQAVGQADVGERVAACDELIARRPQYAEAYNQRAIQHFVRGEYAKAVADCEAVLRLNPFHFGAASGMGQCYLRMHKPRAALRAFGHALEINPDLTHLHEVMAALRDTLGGE